MTYPSKYYPKFLKNIKANRRIILYNEAGKSSVSPNEIPRGKIAASPFHTKEIPYVLSEIFLPDPGV